MLYIIALPILFVYSFKKKYKLSIPARFFLQNNPPFHEQNPIWFHLCSFGEAKAIASLLKALNQQVNITTITQTGYDEAKKYNAEVRYLPYEIFLPFWINKHKLLVVLEAEFWYMLFLVATKKGAKIVLLNARISDRSYPKYYKLRWFYKRLFEKTSLILVQSEIDKKRFLALGAKSVEVVGNIKLAAKIAKTKEYQKPKAEVIVAASTHEGEEEPILDAFFEYKKENPNAKLIVVPRHPERFDAVYALMQTKANKHALALSRFSEEQNFQSDLVLVDAMGELNNIYAISDIAILGGAFREDVGGHNPLEPAFFGCKIITGEHYFNQKELFKYVKNVQFVKTEQITDALYKAKTLPPSSYDDRIDFEKIVQRINTYVKG